MSCTEVNDTLFGKLRPNLRKFFKPDFDGVCSTEIWVLKADKCHCDPAFLFYLVQSERFTEAACKTTGSKMPRADWGVLSLESFYLPPIEEQKKIAEILRTWDQGIEKYSSYLATIRKKRQAIVHQTLIKKEWLMTTLGNIANIIVSNVDKKSIVEERSVRLCNYMDVFYNRYITSNIKFMEATASEHQIARYTLKKGDAIFTKDSETSEDIAVCASVEEDIDMLVCGYHLAIARPKSNNILGAYLAEAINCSSVHHQFVKSANGATRFGLTIGDIESIKLPVPPIEAQRKITLALRQCDKEKEIIEAIIALIKSQKRGLMQRLLGGS